jgi:hypothetical protein
VEEKRETTHRTVRVRCFEDKLSFKKLPTQDKEGLQIIIVRIPKAETTETIVIFSIVISFA